MTRSILAIALAATTALGAAGTASADSYFGVIDSQRSSILDLGTVTSDAGGLVQIFDYNGNLLAEKSLRAGANRNVRVPLNSYPSSDVVAVLTDGTTVLDQQRVKVDRAHSGNRNTIE